MASLADVARAMEKKTASPEPKAPAAATVTAKPSVSLVDVAHEIQATKPAMGAQPLTLMDVARKTETSSRASSTAALQSLAQEINAEERVRLDTVITKAAVAVKQETAQERASVLKAAATEVLREEETRDATPPTTGSPENQHASKAPPCPATNRIENDNDGYSSFEDDDDVEPTKKTKAKKAPERIPSNEEENPSESGGPEKTTPSESLIAKEFLRAIYRGDTRRVRDMMGGEDVDGCTADQHGWSALHWAASQGQSEILSLVLETGARVDAVEHVNGWTALHLAVIRDSVACAKRLLHAGAKTTIQDHYGDTVHELLKGVKGKKKERWLQLFLKAKR